MMCFKREIKLLYTIITGEGLSVKPLSTFSYCIYREAVTILSQKCLTQDVSSAKMELGQLLAASRSVSGEPSACPYSCCGRRTIDS